MKIKHPIPFFITVFVYIAFQAFAWTSTWYFENVDSSLHRDIANVVFFACMGVGLLTIDCGAQYSTALKISAIVMFLLCLLNGFFLMMELTGGFLPSGPQAELDEFGNPVIPDISDLNDLNDYLDNRYGN